MGQLGSENYPHALEILNNGNAGRFYGCSWARLTEIAQKQNVKYSTVSHVAVIQSSLPWSIHLFLTKYRILGVVNGTNFIVTKM